MQVFLNTPSGISGEAVLRMRTYARTHFALKTQQDNVGRIYLSRRTLIRFKCRLSFRYGLGLTKKKETDN